MMAFLAVNSKGGVELAVQVRNAEAATRHPEVQKFAVENKPRENRGEIEYLLIN